MNKVMTTSVEIKKDDCYKHLTTDYFNQHMVCSVSRYKNPKTQTGYQQLIRWLCVSDKTVGKWFDKKRQTDEKFDKFYTFIGNMFADYLDDKHGSDYTGTYYQNCALITSMDINECSDYLKNWRNS